MNLKCDNCDHVCKKSSSNLIKKLHERVEPGGIMPGGECPECGALMYPTAATVDKQQTIKLRLTVDIEYIPNGASLLELTSMMGAIPRLASHQGLMTGDSPAEVYGWTFNVEKVK
jgi:hypothetical protein